MGGNRADSLFRYSGRCAKKHGLTGLYGRDRIGT
jgi:hypothetical protein